MLFGKKTVLFIAVYLYINGIFNTWIYTHLLIFQIYIYNIIHTHIDTIIIFIWRAPSPPSQPHGNARQRCHNTTQSPGQTLALKLPVNSVVIENDESVLVQYKLSCPKEPCL